MRRLLSLALPAALAATFALPAAAAFAQATPAAPVVSAVPSDTLAARAARAETFFLQGKSADLRALSDSTFASMLTDEAHAGFLAQLMEAGGADATGEWGVTQVQGQTAYRRPYRLGAVPQPFALYVVFNAEARIAGMALVPDQG